MLKFASAQLLFATFSNKHVYLHIESLSDETVWCIFNKKKKLIKSGVSVSVCLCVRMESPHACCRCCIWFLFYSTIKCSVKLKIFQWLSPTLLYVLDLLCALLFSRSSSYLRAANSVHSVVHLALASIDAIKIIFRRFALAHCMRACMRACLCLCDCSYMRSYSQDYYESTKSCKHVVMEITTNRFIHFYFYFIHFWKT